MIYRWATHHLCASLALLTWGAAAALHGTCHQRGRALLPVLQDHVMQAGEGEDALK